METIFWRGASGHSTSKSVKPSYISEEQAMQSFDSIDKNKDGVISLEEYVKYAIDFWCNLGEQHGVLNLYGTKDL